MNITRVKGTKLKILLLIILCTYVNVPYYFAGITFLHKAVYYVFALLPVLNVLYKGVLKMEKRLFSFIAFFIICIVAILVITIINNADAGYLEYFLRGVLNIFAMVEIYRMWKQLNIKISFEEIYVLSAINYIIGTLFFILFPSAKDFWMNIIVGYEGEHYVEQAQYATRFGYAGFSGYSVALYVSVAMVYVVYLYLSKRIEWNKTRTYMMFLCLGCLFYGRVGTIATLVIVGITGIYLGIHGKGAIIRTIIKIVTIVSILVALIYKTIPASKVVIEWAFEPIYNYIRYGDFSSLSSDDLFRMYESFSPSLDIWLRGTGYWFNEDGSYYGHTDIGFMRNVYFGGLFYTILFYGVALFLGYMLYKILAKKVGKGGSIVVLVAMFTLVLFEFKGDAELVWLKSMIPFYLSIFDYYVDRGELCNSETETLRS